MTLFEFHRGQKYQFMIDFHPFSSTRCDVREYVANLSEESIIEICNYLCANDELNLILYDGDELWDDDFYEGRCYQFLVDNEEKIPVGYFSLVNVAETHWHDMLMKNYEKEGTSYYIKCCDYCSEWTYGDRRCSCGNRRMMLTSDSDDYRCHLDKSDIRVYPQPY